MLGPLSWWGEKLPWPYCFLASRAISLHFWSFLLEPWKLAWIVSSDQCPANYSSDHGLLCVNDLPRICRVVRDSIVWTFCFLPPLNFPPPPPKKTQLTFMRICLRSFEQTCLTCHYTVCARFWLDRLWCWTWRRLGGGGVDSTGQGSTHRSFWGTTRRMRRLSLSHYFHIN